MNTKLTISKQQAEYFTENRQEYREYCLENGLRLDLPVLMEKNSRTGEYTLYNLPSIKVH